MGVDVSQFERDLKSDKRINRHRLEQEASRQSDLYGYWASELATAKEDRDRAKTTCKKVEGQAEIDYRTGARPAPKDTDGKPMKLTEASIIALVNSDSEVIAARDDLAAEEGKVSYLQGAEEAMQHRRSSINNLVELYTKDYYQQALSTGPSGDVGADQASNNVRKNLNKNRNGKEN